MGAKPSAPLLADQGAGLANEDAEKEITDIDEAIDATTMGRFQIFVFFGLGLGYAADAAEVVLISFLYSCLKEYWDLSTTTAESIVSCVFFGELIGTVCSGPLAGTFGRRNVSLLTLAVVAVAGLLSAASPNVATFFVFRVLVGVGIGGFSVPFDLLAEVTPSEWRGTVLTAYEVWWALGSCYTVLMAKLVLDSDSDWRMLVMLCAVPVFASLVAMWFVPESPRWLLAQGRVKEAEDSIRLVAKYNGVAPLKLLLAKDDSDVDDVSYTALLKTEKYQQRLALLSVVWVVMGFTFYGVSLLLTRVFDGSDDDESECDFDYTHLLIIYSTEVIGAFVLLLTINRWGRSLSQVVLYSVSGVGMLVLGAASSSDEELAVVAGCVGLAAAMGASSALWVHTPELFDTTSRATAHAFLNSMGRVGAFFSSYLVDSSLSTTSVGVVMMVTTFLAATCIYFVPDTRDSRIG